MPNKTDRQLIYRFKIDCFIWPELLEMIQRQTGYLLRSLPLILIISRTKRVWFVVLWNFLQLY